MSAPSLRFVDACTEEHFAAMSLIHALGWRDIPTRLRRAGGPGLQMLRRNEFALRQDFACGKMLVTRHWARRARHPGAWR